MVPRNDLLLRLVVYPCYIPRGTIVKGLLGQTGGLFHGEDKKYLKEVGLWTGVGAVGRCPLPECSWDCFSLQWFTEVCNGNRFGVCRTEGIPSPSASQLVHSLHVFSEPSPPMSVLSHVANERPIQPSLGDQLGFFGSQKLIMSLSLVPFQQLMYLRIHKWPFVFSLSDTCATFLPSHMFASLSSKRDFIQIPLLSHMGQTGQIW